MFENLEEKIFNFLEEDREESKSYGEMADFQSKIQKEFEQELDSLNPTSSEEFEEIVDCIENLEEQAIGYLNLTYLQSLMEHYQDYLETELDEVINDYKVDFARDFCSYYGCEDEPYPIEMIDDFYNKPSDLLDAMAYGSYHGEDYFTYGVFGLEFIEDIEDAYIDIFNNYDIEDKILDEDICFSDYGQEDIMSSINSMKWLIERIEDLNIYK